MKLRRARGATANSGVRATNHRRVLSCLIAVCCACSRPEAPSTEQPGVPAGPAGGATAAEAQREASVHLRFCDAEPGLVDFDYSFEVEEPITGDLSGYAVRVRRVATDSVRVWGAEAIGSFGDLRVVRNLQSDSLSGMLRFELGTARPELPGPRFAMLVFCDSVKAEIYAPFPDAPAESVTLLRWRGQR